MSQIFQLPCECGQKNPVTAAQAGRMIECSACGKSLKVPTLGGLRQLVKPAEEAAVRSAEKEANWNQTKGSLFVVGVLLTLIGLAVGGYATFWLRQIDTEDHTQLFNEEFAKNIDAIDALQAIALFEQAKKMGVGETGVAEHVQMQKWFNYYLTIASVGFGLALIGLTAAIVSLIAPARRL